MAEAKPDDGESKAALLAEAYKRGILPDDVKTAYEEALRRGMVRAKPPEPETTVGGLAKSAARGLVEGAGYVAGLPSDLMGLIDLGWQHGTTKLMQLGGAITSEQRAKMLQPMPGEERPLGSANINAHVASGLNAIGMPLYEPKTNAEQAVRTIAGFVPGGLLGAGEQGAVKAAAKYGLLPGVTSEAAGQMTQGTSLEPWARFIGAVAPGGISAVANKGANMARPVFQPQEVAQDAAKAAMLKSATRPDALLPAVEEAVANRTIPGRAPMSTAQEVNDPGVLALERSVMRATPENVGMAQDLRTAQNEAITRTIRAYAPEIPDAQIAPLRQAVQSEIAALGPGASADQVGNAVRTVLQRGMDTAVTARSNAATPLYEAARASTAVVDTSPVLSHIGDLLKVEKGDIRSAVEKARGNLFVGDKPDTSVEGLMASRKAINSQISQASRAGDTETVRVLEGIKDKLDEALATAPEVAQANATFRQMSPEVNKFDRGVPGKALRQDQYGNDYVMPGSAVPSTFFGSGPGKTEATQSLITAIGKPVTETALRDTIAAEVLRDAVDATGAVNPARLEAITKRYQDSLSHFPGLNSRLGNAKTAQLIVNQKVADQALIDRFLKSTVNAEKDAAGNAMVSQAKFGKFIDANEAELQRVLPQGSLDRLRAVQKELDISSRSVRSGLPGGSDTAQNLAGQSVLKNLVQSTMRRAVSPVVGSIVGTMAGGPVGTIVGGAAGAALDTALASALARQTELTNQLLARAMVDPEVARTLLMRPNQMAQRRLAAHVEALAATTPMIGQASAEP